MAKIAVLLPREYMLEQTIRIVENELPGLKKDLQITKVIETVNAVNEVRAAIDKGVQIVVARGVQAKIMKAYTKVPVVEVVLTSQDIGLLMLEAKKVVSKQCPHIAIVTFENMLSDITYFNQLFQVDLRTYCPERLDQLEEMVEKAVHKGADMIIGGDMVNKRAGQYHVPSIFLSSTEDSIRNALQIASKMSYTADVEKNSKAQFETMLATAFNGIIKINRERKIIVINRMFEELLNKSSEQVTGKLIEDELKDLETDYIESVLSGKRDFYSTSIKVKDIPIMILVAPIQYDDEITGAIISCNKMENAFKEDVHTFQEMFLSGFIAKADFTKFYSKDRKIRENVELAKKYSLSRYPVLIYGEEGTEKEQFAQSIHNNSARKNAPFISVNCGSIEPEEQKMLLFGEINTQGLIGKKGALEMVNYGTIHIGEIDRLSLVGQHQLLKMIHYKTLLQNDIQKNQNLDVRLIASTKKDLGLCVKEGSFRADLYYSISALSLNIPSLRDRKSDIEYLVCQYQKNFEKAYSRFIKISDGAMAALKISHRTMLLFFRKKEVLMP